MNVNRTLALPPVYSPVPLSGAEQSARDHARALAADGAETGTLVWSPNQDWISWEMI